MELSKTTLTALQDFYGRKNLGRVDYQHAVDICYAIQRESTFIDQVADQYRLYLTRFQGLKISPLNKQRYVLLAKLLYKNAEMRKELVEYWQTECVR